MVSWKVDVTTWSYYRSVPGECIFRSVQSRWKQVFCIWLQRLPFALFRMPPFMSAFANVEEMQCNSKMRPSKVLVTHTYRDLKLNLYIPRLRTPTANVSGAQQTFTGLQKFAKTFACSSINPFKELNMSSSHYIRRRFYRTIVSLSALKAQQEGSTWYRAWFWLYLRSFHFSSHIALTSSNSSLPTAAFAPLLLSNEMEHALKRIQTFSFITKYSLFQCASRITYTPGTDRLTTYQSIAFCLISRGCKILFTHTFTFSCTRWFLLCVVNPSGELIDKFFCQSDNFSPSWRFMLSFAGHFS